MGIAEPAVEQPSPRRVLGLRTIVSTSAGLTFASSTFLVVVYVAYFLVGDAAWIPICIAGLLCALAAAAFSELNGMYPSLHGIRLYIRRAFGEKASLVISLTYMSVVTVVVGTEAYVLSAVLHAAVPAIGPPIWILLMLSVATLANFRGLKVAGALQDIITYSVIISIVVMSVAALSKTGFQAPHLFEPGSPALVFNAVGFAIFLFVGFEWVTPLADEVKEARAIPVGMFAALTILALVYSLIAVSMFASGDRQALFGTEAHREPIPHIVFAARTLGVPGRWCMIVTSLCMSLTTFNAGLIGISRFIQGMGKDRVLPMRLGHVNERYFTPDYAVMLVYVIAIVISFIVYLTQQYVILVNAAAATESLIYALAGASVIALRRKEVDTPRPYRMWGRLWLPGFTVVIFIAVSLGVFFSKPAWDYWGAGLLLLLAALAWWAYIHWIAMPRIEKYRAEQAKRPRASRRPPRPAQGSTDSETPTSAEPVARTSAVTEDGLIAPVQKDSQDSRGEDPIL